MSWEGFLWGEEYKKQDLGEQATKAVVWAICSHPSTLSKARVLLLLIPCVLLHGFPPELFSSEVSPPGSLEPVSHLWLKPTSLPDAGTTRVPKLGEKRERQSHLPSPMRTGTTGTVGRASVVTHLEVAGCLPHPCSGCHPYLPQSFTHLPESCTHCFKTPSSRTQWWQPGSLGE